MCCSSQSQLLFIPHTFAKTISVIGEGKSRKWLFKCSYSDSHCHRATQAGSRRPHRGHSEEEVHGAPAAALPVRAQPRGHSGGPGAAQDQLQGRYGPGSEGRYYKAEMNQAKPVLSLVLKTQVVNVNV